MNRFLKLCVAPAFMLAGLGLGGCNGARDTALEMLWKNGDKGFTIQEMTRGDRTRKYGLFIPLHYSDAAPDKYPVIIFLHGVGEGGNDARANMRVGMAPFVADQADTFNFIVIFPQSDNGQWGPDSANAADIFTELADVAKRFPKLDLDRVSLTGLSTGGYGTWAIGSRNKDKFAALVPMGSSASAFDEAPNLVDMPIRCYHNNMDPFAAMWNDTVMVEKIKSLGGKAEMYKTDGPGHDCWEIAYGETDLFTWLAQQRRHNVVTGAPPARAPAGAPASAAPAPIRANSAAAVGTSY